MSDVLPAAHVLIGGAAIACLRPRAWVHEVQRMSELLETTDRALAGA